VTSRRWTPRTVLIVGIVFVVLSVGTALWRWVRGEPIDMELGTLTGGLIVAVVGLYFDRRDIRSTASPNER
jgi:hypothetical protein